MHPAQPLPSTQPVPIDDMTRRRCDEARAHLEHADVDRAIATLEGIPSGERSGDVHALLGVALFRKEQYDRAEAELQRAAELGIADRELADLCAIAGANAVTGVSRQVPERYDFYRAKLLAGPEGEEGYQAGTKLLRKRGMTVLERGLKITGRATGLVLGRTLGGLAR